MKYDKLILSSKDIGKIRVDKTLYGPWFVLSLAKSSGVLATCYVPESDRVVFHRRQNFSIGTEGHIFHFYLIPVCTPSGQFLARGYVPQLHFRIVISRRKGLAIRAEG